MNDKALVLLVEDSPSQAMKYSEYMKHAGYDVIMAPDGITALVMAGSRQPDAIVLDVNLPGMDGFHVCNRLKRDPKTKSIPVVMLTSADTADDALQGLSVGANDYIPKDSFAVQNLLNSLKGLIDINAAVGSAS